MKKVIIKISGELFNQKGTGTHAYVNKDLMHSLVEQIKTISKTHRVGMVVGGGNFFRGCYASKELGLRQTTADAIGMLATVMNGLVLQEFFQNADIPSVVLSSVIMPSVAQPMQQSIIDEALNAGKCLIFVGGTGNPYFTTDTNAVVRGLQMGAQEVWKATKVDYIYDADPQVNKNARPLKQITYTAVLEQNLKVMDLTAVTLAQEHHMTIRVFNLFAPNALVTVTQNSEFGSTIRS